MAKKIKSVQTISAEKIFDGERYLKDKTLVIQDGRIVEIAPFSKKADLSAPLITPAFIDPHSHIGMFRAGQPDSEQEGNDHSAQIRPAHDPLNAVYFDDRTFSEAVRAGVLYSCVIPGSGNLFGGRAKVIRNFAKHRGEAEVYDLGFKMALGFNPRSTISWKGERPNTRMGIYAMLEQAFDDLLRKVDKGENELKKKISELEEKSLPEKVFEERIKQLEEEQRCSFSTDEMLLLDALIGKRTIKVHVHKEDDVLYLLDLKERYDLKITAEHLADVHHQEIFERVAEAGVPIVYGPLGGYDYKTELAHAFHDNASLLMKSGAQFGLMTDHPVIHASALRESTRFFLRHGMDDVGALRLLTKQNAEVIEVDDQIGAIEIGLYASLLVWDKDPFYLGSCPRVVIGEGVILHEQ